MAQKKNIYCTEFRAIDVLGMECYMIYLYLYITAVSRSTRLSNCLDVFEVVSLSSAMMVFHVLEFKKTSAHMGWYLLC